MRANKFFGTHAGAKNCCLKFLTAKKCLTAKNCCLKFLTAKKCLRTAFVAV